MAPRVTIHVSRELVLFAVGLGGFIHEVFFVNTDRSAVVYGSMACMGVAAFLHGAQIVVGGK